MFIVYIIIIFFFTRCTPSVHPGHGLRAAVISKGAVKWVIMWAVRWAIMHQSVQHLNDGQMRINDGGMSG